MKKKTTYYGDEFIVDSETLEIQLRGQTIKVWLNQQQNRNYVSYFGEDGKSHLVTRARIICQAFHPDKNYRNLQTDHIDSDQSNDKPSNLRWVTRKENNSTEHSKKMRSLHSTSHQHRDEVIEAVNQKTGEVKYFANGKHCADIIKCSSPAVYLVLERTKENKKATVKGWTLKWTKDFNEDDLSTIKKERSAVSRVLKRGKFDSMIKKLEDMVKHIEKSIKTREKKVRKMSKMSDRRKTTMSFIEHLKSKKRDIESKIEELVALKFKYTDENGNIMLENNNGDNK